MESSLNTIRVLKSIRMRWKECMTQKERRDTHTWFWLGNLNDLQDIRMYSTIILKWILKKMDEQT